MFFFFLFSFCIFLHDFLHPSKEYHYKVVCVETVGGPPGIMGQNGSFKKNK